MFENHSKFIEVADMVHCRAIVISNHNTLLSPDDLRFDFIKKALDDGKRVFYIKEFSDLKQIYAEQGFTISRALEMVNRFRSFFNKSSLTQLKKGEVYFEKEELEKISLMIPPIIIREMFGEYHLLDGNHRLEIARQVINLESIPVFLIKE